MGKKYLFSPVGNTDPIKYLHDGSMLHIARVYKPDVIYLYMSKEILEHQEADERYTKTLELLGKKLDHKFEIHLIKKESLVNVQDYDIFYREFKENIAKLEAQMGPEDQLLLNMASGTPAMKSALAVLAALAEYRFHAIQVSTPKKKSNQEYEERDDYDVELNWEYNEDNEDGYENRCKEVECLNLISMLKINMIKKHLLAYDYHAAFEIGKEVQEDVSERAMNLLEIASERVKLNRSRMNQLLPKCGYDLIPVKESGKQKVFEYALGLKLKIKKEEYADFIRGVTPVSIDLFELIIKQQCKIDLSKYCFERKGVLNWERNKLTDTEIKHILFQKYPNFHYGIIYSAHLNEIVQNMSDDSVLKEKANDLIEVEQKVRNVAAHEIVSVTEEWILKRIGKRPDDIMNIIQYLCSKAGIGSKKEDWNSYDDMNQKIIHELEE